MSATIFNHEVREQLKMRAQTAADQKKFGELFLLVSALFPASATAQAAALYIFLRKQDVFEQIRESVQQWSDSMLDRLSSLHNKMGVSVHIHMELILELISEIEDIVASFEGLGIKSLDMSSLEKEWEVYSDNAQDLELGRGFLEANLLFSLRDQATSPGE